MRQGKYHMKIKNRQEPFLLLYDTHLLVETLALGAMAVTTAIVADTQVTTFIVGINNLSRTRSRPKGVRQAAMSCRVRLW